LVCPAFKWQRISWAFCFFTQSWVILYNIIFHFYKDHPG
jgi:hypothetical protein